MEKFNYAIISRGNEKEDKEILEILKAHGAKEIYNASVYVRKKDSAYHMDAYGYISCSPINYLAYSGYKIISLERARQLAKKTTTTSQEEGDEDSYDKFAKEYIDTLYESGFKCAPHCGKPDTFKRITIEMNALHDKKNSDYGNAYHHMLDFAGLEAGVGIMYNKLSRLNNLLNKSQQRVKEESIEDTLLDLANYAVMTLEYLRTKK